MVLSSLYHTFTCHSHEVSATCMSLDLLGITLGLLATYLSGIYYAFWCQPSIRDFYLCTVGGIFFLGKKRGSWQSKVKLHIFFFQPEQLNSCPDLAMRRMPSTGSDCLASGRFTVLSPRFIGLFCMRTQSTIHS